ncbi:DUF6192 family protein [Streptomyces sp. AC495_CC817]|uniref:DUF6192 family protein n=1 Tax=Streptomyces sp. AC495_CC817 TaxID=2823900 RepID=UPI0027DF434F|nr:DUF6192 family protein [Streptomyces sp. AC495_CC817]
MPDHGLAQDEEVAATVTGDLLRRPAVVAQVKEEDKVRAVEELTREDQSESLITWAAIALMTRRITRRSSRRNGQSASREAHRD